MFLILPKDASAKLPSRGMTSVEGTINGVPFHATLEPDGQKGHWLKVDRKLSKVAGANEGDVVTLEITPSEVEPEPEVPADLRKALAAADPKAREVWSDITAVARRDWIHWMTSAKQQETRTRRVPLRRLKRRARVLPKQSLQSLEQVTGQVSNPWKHEEGQGTIVMVQVRSDDSAPSMMTAMSMS